MVLRIIRMTYLPEEADEDGFDANVFHYLWAWKRMTPGAHKIHERNIPKLIEKQERKMGLRCMSCNRLREYSDSDSSSDEWSLDF